MITYELKPETKLTEEQEKMLVEAAKRPIEFDDDCPELTDEELAQFCRVSEKRRGTQKTDGHSALGRNELTMFTNPLKLNGI